MLYVLSVGKFVESVHSDPENAMQEASRQVSYSGATEWRMTFDTHYGRRDVEYKNPKTGRWNKSGYTITEIGDAK